MGMNYGTTKSQNKMKRQQNECCSALCFIVGLAVVCVAVYYGYVLIAERNKDACLRGKYTELPLTELRRHLQMNVVGQSVAVETIINNTIVFLSSKSPRPMVLWFSGPEGTGKTLTLNLMKNVLGKVCKVQSLVPSHLPKDPKRLQQEAAALLRGVNLCAPNLLLLDGWDEDSSSHLAVLNHFLKGLSDDEELRNSRVLVVLSGTQGGQEVGEHFLDLRRGGGAESDRDFTGLSITLQDKYYLSQVTPAAVLVPFLPLDTAQVKMCVTRELLMMERRDVLIDEAALTRVQNQVLSRTKLAPDPDLPLAVHGCKRVPSLLTLLLPNLQEDLPWCVCFAGGANCG